MDGANSRVNNSIQFLIVCPLDTFSDSNFSFSLLSITYCALRAWAEHIETVAVLHMVRSPPCLYRSANKINGWVR